MHQLLVLHGISAIRRSVVLAAADRTAQDTTLALEGVQHLQVLIDNDQFFGTRFLTRGRLLSFRLVALHCVALRFERGGVEAKSKTQCRHERQQKRTSATTVCMSLSFHTL